MEIEEPAVSYSKQKMTIEEYLAFENTSPIKHEYYQGDVYAMSGAKMDHNIITGNTFATLLFLLRGRSCRPFNSDQRIHIPVNSLFTYPDISITCGEPVTLNDDKWNLLNPSVIIEVLSPTTKEYNRGLKFKLYKGIPSLREYIMIDSETVCVEHFVMQPGGDWILKEYKNLGDVVFIGSVGIYVTLEEIYGGFAGLKN